MNTTIFSGNIKPVPHFRANNCTTFAKKIIPGRSLRSSFIDPFRFAKKRCNTSQGFGALNSCVDWSVHLSTAFVENASEIKGDHKTRNGGMTEWRKITPNPKTRNRGKSPIILRRGMAENHPES